MQVKLGNHALIMYFDALVIIVYMFVLSWFFLFVILLGQGSVSNAFRIRVGICCHGGSALRKKPTKQQTSTPTYLFLSVSLSLSSLPANHTYQNNALFVSVWKKFRPSAGGRARGSGVGWGRGADRFCIIDREGAHQIPVIAAGRRCCCAKSASKEPTACEEGGKML